MLCLREIDGVEHHLFDCEKRYIFWRRLKEWMISNLEYGFELTVCEILFGIPMNNNYDDSRLLNFLILFGKWYINKRKSNQNPIYFLEYLTLIKDKVRTMMHFYIGADQSPYLTSFNPLSAQAAKLAG